MKLIDLLVIDSLEFDKYYNVFFKDKNNFSDINFLQSIYWAKIQENYGRRLHFCVFKKGEEVISLAVLIEMNIKFVKYFYIPRGPIFDKKIDKNNQLEIFKLLSNFCKENRACFFRFEPLNLIKNNKIKKAKDIQPKKTLYLRLDKSEDEIWSEMKQKTRYNIKLASRKKLDFVWQKNSELAYNNFIKLIKTTSVRDNFSIHSDTYYKNLINYNNNFIRVFEVYHDQQVLVSAIFSFFGGCATYLHGASSDEYRNLMAPYLLQSEVIKIAQKESYKFYDFYGIDEKKWPGVSRFKFGFGGKIFEYPGTFDFVINKFNYFVYSFFRNFRKLLWWK